MNESYTLSNTKVNVAKDHGENHKEGHTAINPPSVV